MASKHFEKWLVAASIGAAALGMMASTPRDSAEIVNSGSTNTVGYSIEVWSDGSASVTTQARSAASPSPAKAFTVPAATATKFFADLAAARTGNAVTVPCMKPASFGSTTHVTWQGWQSPDLTCPPKGALGQALIDDVEQICGLSGIGAAPLRQGNDAPPPR